MYIKTWDKVSTVIKRFHPARLTCKEVRGIESRILAFRISWSQTD